MSRQLVLLTLSMMMVIGLAAQAGDATTPPPTAKVPVAEDFHGTVLTDDYSWLENADDPEVVTWTEAQHAYSEAIIDVLPQKEWLASRYNALWRYDDESVPRKVLDGDRLF